MRVLWICNILFPEVRQMITGQGEIKSSGGWLVSLADKLSYGKGISLAVATVSDRVKKLYVYKGEKVLYYVLPSESHFDMVNIISNPNKKNWEFISREWRPDLIHIHGTELPYGLSYVNSLGNKNVIVSIQGLVGEISKYYLAGISTWDIIKNISIRDFIRGSILNEQKQFAKRGEREKKLLRGVNYVIGRTSFDRAHVWSINPHIKYFYCGEVLRPEFYSGQWSYEQCQPHTIFLSQAGYSIKGLHIVLKSLQYVKKICPDVKVYVAGDDITKRGKSFLKRMTISGYGLYIRRLIKKYSLDSSVYFLGPLDANGMKEEYLKSNVFICPSSIENSPNSLAEAQMLGVPCLASYVGGIPDMIQNNSCGLLYRYDDNEQLAYSIIEIFEKSKKINNSEMIDMAHKRHNSEKIISDLMTAYEYILKR